jgi:hypothetical protein
MSDPHARLEALRAAGAAAWDGPGLDFVVSLFTRAEALDGGARDLLLARAEARLASFEAAFRDARAEAESAVASLASDGVAVPADLESALKQGDFANVRRLVRRARHEHERERRRSERRASTESLGIPVEHLHASAESARAVIAVARAVDNVPEAHGPYNPHVLAARALAAVADLSPAYARALVARLDDLAALDTLLPAETRKSKAPRKRRAAA